MSLRGQVLKGGTFLAVRQGLGMLIGLAGVVTLTRLIGPASYGRYAAAIGLFTYVQSFATWGLNVFLIRSDDAESPDTLHQAFTLLLISGLAGVLIMLALFAGLNSWLHLEGLGVETAWMAAMLPVVLTAQAALAALERGLRYRSVAAIELTGQLTFYLVALPVAAHGAHPEVAPFAGWIAQQAVLSLGQFSAARFRPRLVWDRALIRRMLDYGFSYSASIWVWQVRTLVNPLIVGRFAGLEAVGVVALTIRLVEYLTFVKAAAWRLSLAALGRMQGDLDRIRRAIGSGMLLQLLAVGPFLLGFALVGPWILPRTFGAEWSPVMRVFPFVATSYLFNSLFNLHSSALYALQRNWSVTRFHVIHVTLFAASAFILVPVAGVRGYGIAELVALASYLSIERAVRLDIGVVEQAIPILWATAFAFALYQGELGLIAGVGVVALALYRPTRDAVIQLTRTNIEAYRG